MAHEQVVNKITTTYVEEYKDGNRVLTLKDMDGKEKFQKVGYNEWVKIKDGE